MSIARHGVVVVGGGAVGIEMAAELKLVQPDVEITLAHSRDELLSAEALSKECKDAALALTRESGVEVLLNHRLKSTKEVDGGYELEFENGHKMLCSDVVMAVSKPVSTATYLPQSALDGDNLVKINPKYVPDHTLPIYRGANNLVCPLLMARRMPTATSALATSPSGAALNAAEAPCTVVTT